MPIESLPDVSDMGWTVTRLRSCVEAQKSKVDGGQIAFQSVEGGNRVPLVGTITVNYSISYRVCMEDILNDLHRPAAVSPPAGKSTSPGEALSLVLAVQHRKRFQCSHETNKANTIMWLAEGFCDQSVCVAKSIKDRRRRILSGHHPHREARKQWGVGTKVILEMIAPAIVEVA
jgi:hypothetical protein